MSYRSFTILRSAYRLAWHNGDHIAGAPSICVALLTEVSDLIPNSGPLSQVLGITRLLFDIVDKIKTNKESCEFLVEHILRFLRNLAQECNRLNTSIFDDSLTAERLRELEM